MDIEPQPTPMTSLLITIEVFVSSITLLKTTVSAFHRVYVGKKEMELSAVLFSFSLVAPFYILFEKYLLYFLFENRWPISLRNRVVSKRKNYVLYKLCNLIFQPCV